MSPERKTPDFKLGEKLLFQGRDLTGIVDLLRPPQDPEVTRGLLEVSRMYYYTNSPIFPLTYSALLSLSGYTDRGSY
jgi:hypothetical protein